MKTLSGNGRPYAALFAFAAVLCGAAPAAAQNAPDPAKLAPMAAALEKHYARLEAALREMPREQFESQAVIELVGRDPDALFAWVRDNTALFPYRGALRGPAGVLMDRGGNSLDRSLLLADLLQSAGHSVRLANGKLGADVAAQLLARARAAKPDASAPPAGPAAAESRRRVAEHADRLLAALGQVDAGAGRDDAAFTEALSDHWWVQRQAGGNWVDLDVCAPGAQPGRGLAPAARTVPLSPGGSVLAALAPRDCHEVEFRVVIEAATGGQLRTETVLAQTLRPADTIGRSLNFTHFVGRSLKTEGLGPDPASVRKLKAALAAQTTYLPVLWVDDRPVQQASFTTAGVVDRKPKVDPAGMIGAPAAGAFGGFGGALGGGGAAPAGPQGHLTAEWIEYEVRVPGRPPQVVRREVFDLVGPAARAAGAATANFSPTDDQKVRRAFALVGRTQILLQPCDLAPAFALHRFAAEELRDAPVWLSVARGQVSSPEAVRNADFRFSLADQATPLFALLRGEASPATGRSFVDRPNVIHHRVWVKEDSDGTLAEVTGMDLALTSTAHLGEGAFRQRVLRGVADTLAEHLALGDAAMKNENTVGVFDAAARAGAAPVAVRPGQEKALEPLKMPPDALARARADLAAGNAIVVAGNGDGRFGWWRVDLATGQTVGVMDNGYHSALTENRLTAIDKELAAYSRNLDVVIKRESLRKASKEQIAAWAKNNPNIIANLEGIQLELTAIWNQTAAMRGLMFF